MRELIDEGLIEEVQVEGYNRRYLAPRGWSDAQHGDYDNEARILGPLDPLLWDRVLLQHAFNFEYMCDEMFSIGGIQKNNLSRFFFFF